MSASVDKHLLNKKYTPIRVLDIIEGTSVDGPGLRTSVYLAGCHHHCPGCHNPTSWNPYQGEVLHPDKLIERLIATGMDITFSGGDPMYQARALYPVMRSLKLDYTLSIWCYTGFVFSQVTADHDMRALLDWIDVLVDGPFISSLRDTSLLFRGSSNQRLIDIENWRHTGELTEWISTF